MAGYLPVPPFGGGGIEGLDQIPENHVIIKADKPNTVKDEGIIVSDTEFDIGPQRSLKVGLSSLQLGDAHSTGAGGENVFTKNLIDNGIYHPAWQEWDGASAVFRRRLQPMRELEQESSKADVLTNPRWRSDPIVDWTVVQLTFEAAEPETNVFFTVEKDGTPFWSVRLPDMAANVETTLDLTADKNMPVDAFQSGEYFVSVRSDDGEVKLKGNAQNGIPFFKVGYHEFIDEPLVLPEKVLELSGGSSGLTSGGRISAATTTAISIAQGAGRIYDYSNMSTPTYFDVEWAAIPSVELTNITTESLTHIVQDRTGAIRQFRPDEEAFLSRDFIYLGYVWHPNAVIDQIINDSLTPHEPYVQLLDLLDTLGVVRGVGLNITLNDDMTFSKSSGNVLMAGAGNINQERKSNLMSIAAASPQTFSRLLGRTITVESANTDQVKADIWDDGTQTGATLPGTAAQILYFYQFPLSEGVVMVYGQNVYTGGISEALASAVADASNIQLPQGFTDKALLLFRLVITGNATVLSDSNQAVYLIGPKFGTTLSGGAGGTGAGGDYFGPADSQTDEVHTFNDDTGKIGKSGSDITAIDGVFERVDNNADLTARTKGTGAFAIDAKGGVKNTGLTTTERDALTHMKGLWIFNSTTDRPEWSDGDEWLFSEKTFKSERVFYVDVNQDDDTDKDGSLERPYRTILAATTAAKALSPTADSPSVVHLAPGTYAENISLRSFVYIIGESPELCIIDGGIGVQDNGGNFSVRNVTALQAWAFNGSRWADVYTMLFQEITWRENAHLWGSGSTHFSINIIDCHAEKELYVTDGNHRIIETQADGLVRIGATVDRVGGPISNYLVSNLQYGGKLWIESVGGTNVLNIAMFNSYDTSGDESQHDITGAGAIHLTTDATSLSPRVVRLPAVNTVTFISQSGNMRHTPPAGHPTLTDVSAAINWLLNNGIRSSSASIDNEIVVFSGTNGKLIKNGAGVKAEQGAIMHADAGGNLLITHNQGGRIRVGFGMSIESSGPAIFTISSTTQGSIPAPPMTKAQRDNILNPIAGLQVYVTDDMGGYVSDYNGQEWSSKAAGGASVYTISQQYLAVVPEASNFLTAYRKTPLTYYGPDALVENIRVYAGKAPAGGVTSIFTVTAGSVPIGLGTLPRGDNQTEDLSVPAGVTIGNGQIIEFSWVPIFGGAGAENLEVFITIRPQ